LLYYSSELAPEWGVLALAMAARGLEYRGVELVRWRGGPVGEQRDRLLGVEWDCEYYVDFGALGVRALRGGSEGFVLKGAVLERCDAGPRVRERVLHPVVQVGGSKLSYLPVVGGERLRQAAVYIAELAVTLSLARRGRVLVVRHGALLQQIASYFNKVYDLDCDLLEVVLRYGLLGDEEAREIVRESRIKRPGSRGHACNAGLAILSLLERVKEAASHATIAAVAEDLSRTRYLSLLVAAEAALAYAREPGLNASSLLEPAVEEARGCLHHMGLTPQDARYDLARSLEELMASTLDPAASDSSAAVRDAASTLGRDGVVEAFYRGQLMDRLGVSSDVETLMVYRFLYGPRDEPATAVHDKGALVYPPVAASMASNRIPEHAEHAVTEEDARETISGFKFLYLTPDPTPTCRDLEGVSERLGRHVLEPMAAADLVKVRHPIKLEYVDSRGDPGKLISHVYTQALATLYGVPAPLIVVDQRSRVTEWDASVIRSLLEQLGRRVVPYSTFIRDFATRRKYMS